MIRLKSKESKASYICIITVSQELLQSGGYNRATIKRLVYPSYGGQIQTNIQSIMGYY